MICYLIKKRTVLCPGMISEEHNESLYTLKTKIGTINVYKASEVFKNSKSSYIFNRRLLKWCYERTFDFLKENRDYKAALSYDEVIDSFNKVLKEVPNLNTDDDKLEVLTLYYAKKKSIK